MLKTSRLGHGQSQNVFTIISSRVVLTRGPLYIGTLAISMLIWNYGEIRQRYSVVFESWKPGGSFGSGTHMKAENRMGCIRYDTNI